MRLQFIIFPHQLFYPNKWLQPGTQVILVEEFLFFRQYNFHQQKIMLHRASMKTYESYLRETGHGVRYIESTDERCDIRKLLGWLAAEGYKEIAYIDPVDDWLQKRITRKCTLHHIRATKYDTGYFLNDMISANKYFDKKRSYFQTAFYIDQRKTRKILVDDKLQPAGGEWSYDHYNREKMPKGELLPRLYTPAENKFVTEAKDYVKKYFPGNYGETDHFFYPVNPEDAALWLQDFFEKRFEKFGVYEDAIVSNEHFLYHSGLSPMLNTGLLTPQYVIDKSIEFAEKNLVPLNSLEGFLRQIMGWREYIRIVYERESVKQRTRNFWGFERKIPASFWKAETGIVPLDDVIRKVLKTGYCHHIERLMVLGNFMLLCEFDPDDVYRWFMELFIDSYDWVMVPNTYGMTQFADGGLMTTKPYISGSNYLLKMSDHKKGEWSEIWDGLFWRFIHVHRDLLAKNQRLGMLIKTFDKMTEEKRKAHLNRAEIFLKNQICNNETKEKIGSAAKNLSGVQQDV
ncbi:cryptochrome/photolyase family protein [Ferruginibacter sp. HRS2-29]|uniref:cryptochrome/photolyase family protein n=1 Tax=Ferruginibacter sp. HRS2-29 TaxID=2487334 RepID=UPI0020CCDEAE|nr:cryptochrome/photolyase family protein [Ferruginibacter sp. HRS2-29]MCP9750415.1 cryptochrome/photolyase family protein [Ferruginibacter sp. HRS2-29]